MKSKFYQILRTFFPISAKMKNQTTQILSTIMKNYFSSKREFRKSWSENAFFRNIQNLIKSGRFEGFFLISIPNVLEHWSLFKELFSSIA